jgi:acetoin utilization deacetylase AcuC-like enzyme
MLDKEYPEGLVRIRPEPATLGDLELVHTAAYIERVLKTADHNFTSLAPDTPASGKTYLAAWLAVGGCLKALEALLSQESDACFALVRPPGHHALPDRAGGFCIFNNIGITARCAMKHHGISRILVIDWDVHHGNGIHDLFYGEKEVFYVSSHDMLLYPYTGDWQDAGVGPGKGYTVNLPLPRELEDTEFLYLYQEILGPIMRQYDPELILVAAGFDAHQGDPIGRSRFTAPVYGRIVRLILKLRAEIHAPPILLVLEGGYDAGNVGRSVIEVLRALTSDDPYEPVPIEASGRGEGLVEKACQTHGKYGVWADKAAPAGTK